MLCEELAENIADCLVVIVESIARVRIQAVLVQGLVITLGLPGGPLLGRQADDLGNIRLVDVPRLGDRATGKLEVDRQRRVVLRP